MSQETFYFLPAQFPHSAPEKADYPRTLVTSDTKSVIDVSELEFVVEQLLNKMRHS